MNSTNIQLAADLLWNAAQSRETCEPVRTLIGTDDLSIAYAVQSNIIDRRIAAGGIPIGCKIGLTSPAVQKQLGVDQPDFGILFKDMVIPNGGSIAMSAFMQPKIEAEIAFVLGEDLFEDITEDSVADAIEYATASIEIAGSRVRDWDIRITDTIADNASANHFVLGDDRTDLNHIDLINCKMKLFTNGELVSEGQGSACMGSPLIAATWLAKTMLALGNPLKKGDVIMSGALGPMSGLKSGDVVTAQIEGFSEVSFKAI